MGNNKTENNNITEETKNNDKFNFILNILKNNIGNLVDDFIKTNMGQPITKYNSNTFVQWIVISMKESEKEIIKEFKELCK